MASKLVSSGSVEQQACYWGSDAMFVISAVFFWAATMEYRENKGHAEKVVDERNANKENKEAVVDL